MCWKRKIFHLADRNNFRVLLRCRLKSGHCFWCVLPSLNLCMKVISSLYHLPYRQGLVFNASSFNRCVFSKSLHPYEKRNNSDHSRSKPLRERNACLSVFGAFKQQQKVTTVCPKWRTTSCILISVFISITW